MSCRYAIRRRSERHIRYSACRRFSKYSQCFWTKVPLFIDRLRHFMMTTPIVIRLAICISNRPVELRNSDTIGCFGVPDPPPTLATARRHARLVGVVTVLQRMQDTPIHELELELSEFV